MQAVQRLHALLAPALRAELLLVESELRVAFGEIEDPALVAAFGGADLDGSVPALRQRLGHGPDVTQLALYDQQRRHGHGVRVVLEDECLGHLGDRAAGLVVQVEALAIG